MLRRLWHWLTAGPPPGPAYARQLAEQINGRSTYR